MPDHKPAAITVTSLQEENEVVQRYQGQVFRAGGAIYIKYEELGQGPSGEEVTRVMVKISPGELKLIRHGAVESSQTFQAGKKLPGHYRAAYTSFNLSTDTRELSLSLDGLSGTAKWNYDLYVYDELAGHFDISLHIQEEA
ncbi:MULTISPECIES: DUF1934 domain-containing protein [Paenibacillus]|uniref:DUF1934 domain-containing protein n=1 Tax=Paenibacillus TaxID=44249 RepID=UPI00083985F7|nr:MULTISPECIES: DUF1934 domain-containing protein [Paenibacillus]GIP24698.1 hypothetical protein J22TS3_49730 [Paenibacillus sp. J22TS3]